VERAEQQLRLIRAVYRVEHTRQHGEALEELRVRCEALLDVTARKVDGDDRLRRLLDEIRREVRDQS
jgi:uncharacterized alpha-E superfamily protein